ncbi:MAG: hypothetical protein ACOYZ8_16480 [Chloroflexota bacterium]
MKTQIVIAQLAIILGACAPLVTPLPAEIFIPTGVSPTATIVYPTPSPISTLPPPPIFTPDAIQVERWQEYQTELIKAVLSGYDPALYKYSLCEWDILGRSGQEVYVWAYCATLGGGSENLPAVIHLEVDGSIQNVEVPMRGSTWDSNIQRMFPVDVREKIELYYSPTYPYEGRPEELRVHLHYRRAHPEEPPLVVLSAMPPVTPAP